MKSEKKANLKNYFEKSYSEDFLLFSFFKKSIFYFPEKNNKMRHTHTPFDFIIYSKTVAQFTATLCQSVRELVDIQSSIIVHTHQSGFRHTLICQIHITISRLYTHSKVEEYTYV